MNAEPEHGHFLINTTTRPVKVVLLGYTAKVRTSLETKEITVYRIELVYYPHPMAINEGLVNRIEENAIGTYRENTRGYAAAELLLHASKNFQDVLKGLASD